jgi:hypothetical protein
MTAPLPDLLDAIVARYPGMVTYRETSAGNWAVDILDEELGERWHVGASTRRGIAEAAAAWERHRDGFLHGPRPCTCGRIYAMHLWDERSASKRGACPAPAGDRRYQPQDLAVLAGREKHDA